MRFDDKLATVLAQSLGNPAARALAWRQVADILAQRTGQDLGAESSDEQVAQAFALLRALRPKIPAALRAETARTLGGLAVSPDLIAFYAEDSQAIAATAIAAARLDAGAWRALIPALKPAALALVHERAEHDPAIAEALGEPVVARQDREEERDDDRAPAVAVLPLRHAPRPHEAAPAEPIRFPWPLRERGGTELAPEPAAPGGRLETFRFETDAEGILIWTDAAPRGCLIGYSLAAAAGADGQGVDGQAAGAFRHRAPFRDARLNLLGGGPAAGPWRLSAVPFFDNASGRFLGYRGTGRRPRRDDTAAPHDEAVFDGTFPPDALRQLVHELRTPLNAVAGFAEMIGGQFLGPAAAPYRARAAEIVGEARRLLRAVDDLDVAARIETKRIGLEPDTIDASALLGVVAREYAALATARGAALVVAPHEAVAVEADAMAVDRMFSRLLGASVGLAKEGERIAVELIGGDDEAVLRVGRPQAVSGRDERMLLDPGFTPEGDWPEAPLLGLGFTLRLVRNLAAAAGGRLDIAADVLVLALPAAGAPARRGESQA